MSNHTNSPNLRTQRPLLALSLVTLAVALAFSTVAAPAAYAGGAAGGVVGSKNSQGGKHSSGVETSGRKPGMASGSGA